jgi:hypothetical protein
MNVHHEPVYGQQYPLIMRRTGFMAALILVALAAGTGRAAPPGAATSEAARIEPAAQEQGRVLKVPPDSPAALYMQARERLNRGEYQEAAGLFGEVTRHDKARGLVSDALYWQAFALYRLGSPQQLQQARTLLERQREQLSIAERNLRETVASHHVRNLEKHEEQVRQSQAALERQRRQTQANFQQQRKEVATAQEARRKERQTALAVQQEANEKFLLEMQERNLQSLAELDERRQQVMAGYETRSREIQRELATQVRRRHSREAREAIERQHTLALQALEEQRLQSETQMEVQRQQFLDAFARQRRQTEQALAEQQARMVAAWNAGEEENNRLLAEIDRRHQQTLQALEQSRRHLQQQFEEQVGGSRAAYRESVERIQRRSMERREQSMALGQRIAGALAQQGDATAIRELRASVVWPSPCSDETQMAARLESLIALSKVDPAAVRPVLARILGGDGKCSRSMRERAVFLLSLQRDEPAARMLIEVARSDAEMDVRQQALLSLQRSRALAAVSKDLIALYEQVEQPQHRRLLLLLYARSMTAATTAKLIAVARSEEQGVARQAIALLRDSKDPRAREALKELASGE